MPEQALPARVADGLRALSTEIDRLDQPAADRHGLTPTDLARLLGFTTGGATTVLDRLERAGYVCRRADTADRRRLVVETTAATAARDQEVFGDLIRQTGALLATYTNDQLAVIDDFLTRARQLTAAYASTLTGRDSTPSRQPRTGG